MKTPKIDTIKNDIRIDSMPQVCSETLFQITTRCHLLVVSVTGPKKNNQ